MSKIAVDEEIWERFMLICKPEQSGKTFIMIKQIIKDFTEACEGKTVINFIFCDNNLLLTKQTSDRVKDDLEEIVKDGESYIEFSSRNVRKNEKDKATNEKDKDGVWKAITGPRQIRNVICCTNTARVDDIISIVKDFNLTKFYEHKFTFKIWLDEADKFISFIVNQFIPLIKNHSNVHVFCLTATPETLFNKFNYMNVMPIENTTIPEYHGWNDNYKTILENESGTTEGFIHHVLTNLASARRGSKWYIPAGIKKVTHEQVRDSLLGKGFAVICGQLAMAWLFRFPEENGFLKRKKSNSTPRCFVFIRKKI